MACRSGEIDPMSAAFLQMASIFSELEKNILRSRERSGMANAKAKGRQIGRRPTTKADLPAVFIKYYPAYANGTMSVTELARIHTLFFTFVMTSVMSGGMILVMHVLTHPSCKMYDILHDECQGKIGWKKGKNNFEKLFFSFSQPSVLDFCFQFL